MKKTVIYILTFMMLGSMILSSPLVWPPQPDQPRIEYIRELKLADISGKGGFFSKIRDFFSGDDKDNIPNLPYDIVVDGDNLLMTCQGLPALVVIDKNDFKYKLFYSKENPFVYPLALCKAGDDLYFITDSMGKKVYKFQGNKITLFISESLVRPTGIEADPDNKILYIIDTGDHSLKLFGFDGNHIKTISIDKDQNRIFNFPTAIIRTKNGDIIVNDAMNFKIRRFGVDGKLINSFGEEGDGPGTFARPKGIDSDSDNNIYVVDNLFDNFQIFDSTGQVLLVVGNSGQDSGQFWSPNGIDINNDTIYIADTYNNRIQIFRYLGGK